MKTLSRLSAFGILAVTLPLALAGCGTAAASQAGPGNEAERLATLSRSIAGRFDALAADDALLFDDGWRSETVRELRQAAALAGGMARQAPGMATGLEQTAAAYAWLADSVEAMDLAGMAAAGRALETASASLR